MAQPVFYIYSGAFIPGTLARAEAEAAEFTSVQVGFDKLAIQGVDSGAANAYVVTTSGAQNGQYSDGMVVEFKAANSNTGGSTIAVDSGSTVGLTQPNGQSLAAGAIIANNWYICRYNSTYSAWTVIAPSSTVITSNTISAAAPTHLVGLTPAGGVSTACAPIDATFALDQTISPTMTGSWTFAGAVAFSSSVSFASGFTLTGGNNAYAITLDGSATTGESYGVEINAGTNASDIAFLVNSHSGTQFFEILGTGAITVGAPTGGSQGAGTINATGLYVNGVAVSNAVSHNPTATIGLSAVNGVAATFMTSDSAPALSQAIVPTMTGAWTFTPSSAVTAATINAAVNAIGLAIVGNTNTSNTALMSLITGQGSGFSSGLLIEAGTTGADNALRILNAAASATLFEVFGNGEVVCGGDNASLTLNNSANANIASLGTVKNWLVSGSDVTDFAIGATSSMLLYAANNVNPSLKLLGVAAPTIQGWGPTANGLVDMTPDTGSFTITYTGMTGSVTGTAVWARVGNLVSLYFPAATGTSNTTTMTATGMPAEIQPARAHNFEIQGCVENNTGAAWASAMVSIATSGVVTFTNSAAGVITGGGFTNSGTKGIAVAFTVTYFLN